MGQETNGNKKSSQGDKPKTRGDKKSTDVNKPETNGNQKSTHVDIPEDAVKNLTVEEMYDKEKYDLSTMKEDDVFKMLEYVQISLYLMDLIDLF